MQQEEEEDYTEYSQLNVDQLGMRFTAKNSPWVRKTEENTA